MSEAQQMEKIGENENVISELLKLYPKFETVISELENVTSEL